MFLTCPLFYLYLFHYDLEALESFYLDYDIEIKSINNKKEKKYENLINEEKILLENNHKNDNVENGNDENFNYIGKDEENINIIENKINNLIDKNMEKYNNLSNMIDFNEFLLN